MRGGAPSREGYKAVVLGGISKDASESRLQIKIVNESAVPRTGMALGIPKTNISIQISYRDVQSGIASTPK